MRFGIGTLAVVAACSSATKPPALSFEKHTLDTAYRAEGVAVFDVDKDGHPDIVTDQYWYSGPGSDPHEIRTPETYDPATQFGKGFAVYPEDLDGDGYQDIVVAPHPTDPMLWYQNPHGADVHWTPHVITPALVAGIETPIVADLFGDGGHVLVMSDSVAGVIGWYEVPTDPTQPWILHPMSAPASPAAAPFTHGIGLGDVNGDGKTDALTGFGWFEQTADRATWKSHAFAFGRDDCARMYAYDVDDDGLADVLCSVPHAYGLRYWRQQPAAPGADPSFTENTIDDTISQMHALGLADLDGDGVPELVSGKRFWAHGSAGDPGVADPAVLAVYQMHRPAAGQVSFTRILVDADSGVGTSLALADADGDGKTDIVTSSKKGLFFFRSR